MNVEKKIESIKAVLMCRRDIVRIILQDKNNPDREYYKGKEEGYQQAIDLLNESEESIEIELL